ncbi:MAG: TrmH family RNA methyltransferase [Cellulosilyticaceae bacterium]
MENKFISSNQNEIIKNIRILQKKKSERKKQGLFIVEGLRAVNEIPDEYKVEYIITTDSFDATQVIHLEKYKWIVVTDEIFKLISDTETPQGVMAVVHIKCYSLASLNEKDNPFYLLLENVQDPGNLGTIIRTAYGFGVDAIFVSKGSVDVYSPKAVRATMGAVFHVPIIMDFEATSCIQWLKEKEIPIYATALEESKVIYDNDFSKKTALVIGNEANGVSEEVKEMATTKVRIPMPGGLESLNASIAAAVCMYEVMKQRGL